MKIRFYLLLFVVATLITFNAEASVLCADAFGVRPVPRVQIGPDEVALFAYGSLLNVESMQTTLGRPYTGPVIPIRLNGWARAWDVVLHNEGWYFGKTSKGRVYPKDILYLNVQRARGKSVNGMLFVIKKSDLAQMDAREMVYDQADVTQDLEGVKVAGGHVVTYVGRKEFVVKGPLRFPEVGLRSSYLSTVMSSVNKQPADFQKEFTETTAPLPPEALFEDHPDYTAKWD